MDDQLLPYDKVQELISTLAQSFYLAGEMDLQGLQQYLMPPIEALLNAVEKTNDEFLQ